MILASAIRQVRGLGDNKFEVVTSLRTFIFRAEREGTSAPFTFYCALFAVINQLFSSFCLSVGSCSSDRLISLSGLVFLSCFPPSLCLALSKRLIFHLTPVAPFSHTQFSLSQFSPS